MRRMAVACLVSVVLCAAGTALAQDDITPKVDPARIDDVPVQAGETFEQALARFDNFSWRAFIALNWPSQQGDANRGLPDTTKKFGDAGARVWETYKARYEVFAPGAPKPANWDQYDGTNPCGGAVTNRTKTLSAFSHFADFNQAAFALGQLANPLIDQNRTYTRYEVRFNREQFNSIFDNQWYIKSKQPTPERPGVFKFGSIEIKAAWRVLKSGDNVKRERYYVTKAFVFDPEATTNTGSVACSEQDVALVGFHIVIKTPARPQWIWTTFEHVDNVPPPGPVTRANRTPRTCRCLTPTTQVTRRNPPCRTRHRKRSRRTTTSQTRIRCRSCVFARFFRKRWLSIAHTGPCRRSRERSGRTTCSS